MATKQETFDTVVAHLRRQGCKSLDKNGCAYRGENGRMCAAGCLIPDDRYNSSFENKTVIHELVSDVLSSMGHDLHLVEALQIVHDKYDVCHWESEFARVADENKLTYTPPVAPPEPTP